MNPLFAVGRAATLLVALVLPSELAAQPSVTLAGRVVDTDGRPVGNAHVYVAGSMLGTITRPDGRYVLEGLARGSHRVVASVIGFHVRVQELTIREFGRHELDFVLAPKVYELAEIEVSLRAERRWRSRLERFTRAFIGTSSFADSVRILNPEVLDFSMHLGRLRASARAPLEIENRALGYHLRYDLTVFEALPHRVRYTGDAFFTELEPRDEAEAARWRANRERAYRGSSRHLLRALIRGTLEEEGFIVHHLPDAGPRARSAFGQRGLPSWPRPVRTAQIIRPTEQPNVYRLAFAGMLEVYFMEPEDERFPTWEWNPRRYARPRGEQHSSIYLARRSTLVDARGELADPFGIVRMGYLAFRRIAMLMPVEYGLD